MVDRAAIVHRYGRCGHVRAAVSCENALHARTGGRRHDHREGCEDAMSRGCEGVLSLRPVLEIHWYHTGMDRFSD